VDPPAPVLTPPLPVTPPLPRAGAGDASMAAGEHAAKASTGNNNNHRAAREWNMGHLNFGYRVATGTTCADFKESSPVAPCKRRRVQRSRFLPEADRDLSWL
jgi:hypothetical protein